GLSKASELLHRDPRELIADALNAIGPPQAPDRDELTERLLGPSGLTAKRTSFDRRDALQALTEAIPTGLPVTGRQLEDVVDDLLRDGDAVPLLQPAADAGERRWSTVELLEVEADALRLATAPTGVRPAAADTIADRVDGLPVEQRDLVTALLTSTRGVDVVVGPAGSGKTATLRAAAAGWTDHHNPVLGCAVAAVTARRLEAATGIGCASIAKLLADLDSHAEHLPVGTVVVVDEASMVGTRDLHRLLTHTHAVGGKLVLVGDPAQLPEIDAGGLFAALAAGATPLQLTTNRRQHHSWEAQALLDLRDGRIDSALDAYVSHHRVHVLPDVEQTRARVARDYTRRIDRGAATGDVVVLASTRDDV
ncbi:MAG TPA: AAA family ATPase, partial [Mycobacteriales bacterium]|nr:AAA family ATPase [Mycobacteriales bacterium]